MSTIVLERGIVQEEDELENKGQLPAGLRIRKTQHATTLRLLIDAISEFNAEQVDYKEKCEERIQRVVSIGTWMSFELDTLKYVLTYAALAVYDLI